jgi:penicillin-binding protein 1B
MTPEGQIDTTSHAPKTRRYAHRYRVWDAVLAGIALLAGLFLYFCTRYTAAVDRKIAAGPYANTLTLYSAPMVLHDGDAIEQECLVGLLQRSGYSTDRKGGPGWYIETSQGIEIHNGPEARAPAAECRVQFRKGRTISVTPGGACTIKPRLIANVSEGSREKRRPMTYSEIPPVLVQAVISVEDKRFFQHRGVDFLRVAKAAYVDMREGRKEQGASTLTMQLVRSLWLEPDKKWRRKLKEIVTAMHVEEKLSKEQIFEYYANEIYLGRYGTFGVHGFGEGARAFFNKEPKNLNVQEAALLAGLARAPSVYNPLRNPQQARERRNLVLSLMRRNGYITDSQWRVASESPLGVKGIGVRPSDSPFLMDLVHDEVQKRLGDSEATYRVFTTVDLDLQRAAEEAIKAQLPKVDALVKRTHGKDYDGTPVEVALVALDPHSGEVKALVGGRDYARSQLNRALALRQPGSVFKPFVYAAALNTAVDGRDPLYTPATLVSDEPSTFMFRGKAYQPGNFHGAVYGELTLRNALAKSVNVATVKLAESVGYHRIADLAHRAGLNHGIAGTPAVALGAYEATPFEMAGAYTIFANQGIYVKPTLVSSIQGPDGQVIYSASAERRRVLDQRVAYLTVNMMEEVMRSGTAAGVRSRGFSVPAAGKTGTSRDGWFAGFTSQLVAVVWVGFDDNRDVKLEGSKAALPIWTEFMKRALDFPAYRGAKPFRAPSGIVSAVIDPDSGLLAGEDCRKTRVEFFVAGTAPDLHCESHDFTNPLLMTGAPPQSLPVSQ